MPVLSWTATRGALHYHVQLSASPDFATLSYEVTTANVRTTPTRTLPAGQTYWRVRAIGADGAGAWTTAAFTVAAVAAPVPLSPVDDSVLQPPGDVPLLEWSDVASADTYEVMVDDEPNFIAPETYTVRSPTLLRRASQVPGTTYFWRVRAVADGQSGRWSPTWSWAAAGLLLPALVRPANSSTAEVQDVVLEWTPVRGAISYDVRVGTDQAFSTVVLQESTISTRYSPATTLNNDQYWWQVRPRDTDGNSLDWADVPTWQFQRTWPQAPQLQWPSADATTATAPMFYQWSAIPHASRYQLDVSTDRNFSPANVRTCFTPLTTFTPAGVGCMPVPGAATYWRVRGIDDPGGVNSLYSATGVFTYSTGDVHQLLPEQGATVDVPSMRWRPLPHAEFYVVYLSRPDGGVSQFVTYSTSYTPETKLPAGTYGWQVKVVFRDGTTSQLLRGYPRTFTVSANPPEASAATPDPLTPAMDATPTYRAPSLTWKPTTGADYYRVVISGPDTDRSYVNMPGQWAYPAATDTTADRFAAGTYRWFVEAFAASGTQPIAVGAVGTFVVSEPAMVLGQGLSLTGTGIDVTANRCSAAIDGPVGSPQLCANLRATPVLDWTPVPDAAFYLLYLSRDRSMTNRLPGYDGVRVPASRWAPTSTLPDSQAGDAYYWAVRPCVSERACGPEPDRAGHAFDKRSFQVSGLVPSAGATVSGRVTLSWDEYRTTNLAIADATTGLISDQGARQYRVQVATDSTFKGVIEDTYVDQTTYTSRGTTYPDGPLYWRVRAVDGSGTELPWSTAQTLTKSTPGPAPSLPLDGGALRSAQMLRWQPEAGVLYYEVEVYKNDDRLFSAENLVRRATSPLAAITFDVPLPSAPHPYVWRVRRIDAAGRPGQWSAARSFLVKGTAVVLGAPSSGYQPARTMLFTWQPVSGAAGYRIERRRADGSVDERVDTAGTSWAPLTQVPDGSYDWRVVALDAAGQDLAASGWKAFKVDGTAPTVMSVTPIGVIKPAQDLGIAFSERVTGVGTGTVKLFQRGQQHPLPTTVRLAASGRTAVINPQANLRVGRTYVLRVTAGIRDAAGNQVAPTAWTVSAQR